MPGAPFTMYDSTNPSRIPITAQAVAGYSDGKFNWPGPMWSRFINSYRLPITVVGLHDGARVCDVETGDLTPLSGALWCSREIVAGRRPTVYCNRSTFPAVASALKPRGLLFGRDVSLWLADPGQPFLTGVPYPGLVAKQYSFDVEGAGSYDLSIVDATWLQSVANPPTGHPSGVGITDATVVQVTNVGTTFTSDIGTIRHLQLPPSAVLVVQTVPPFTTDAGTLTNAGVL